MCVFLADNFFARDVVLYVAVVFCSFFPQSEYNLPILIDQLLVFCHLYLFIVQETVRMLVFKMEI